MLKECVASCLQSELRIILKLISSLLQSAATSPKHRHDLPKTSPCDSLHPRSLPVRRYVLLAALANTPLSFTSPVRERLPPISSPFSPRCFLSSWPSDRHLGSITEVIQQLSASSTHLHVKLGTAGASLKQICLQESLEA